MKQLTDAQAAQRAAFLAKLAETSNVSASAKAAGVSTSTVYAARRSDREFAQEWRKALCEGYDNLEIELLLRLRKGQRASAKTRFDNAAAIRLLLAHRDEVSQQRALDEEEDEEAVLASLTAKLDTMRRRQVEVDKMLAEDCGVKVPDDSAD